PRARGGAVRDGPAGARRAAGQRRLRRPPYRDRLERDARGDPRRRRGAAIAGAGRDGEDRKSTRLNSSHEKSSYAVFCWKKKTLMVLLHWVNTFRQRKQIVLWSGLLVNRRQTLDTLVYNAKACFH